MVSTVAYRLVYDTDVPTQLRAIERKHHSLIRTMLEEQLRFEPAIETQNRKPLTRPPTPDARWELRFGRQNRFRVFYRVHEDTKEVYILAIGVKIRNRLFVGGEEYEL
ncbi:MAG: hypothetical protein M9936_21625 [Caldilinea sp.]|nr:hypothetical protein [Caldilinea sp.]MCB0055505.1 hypothetical protein [Caldilineaceae bacterium]MCB0040639.1 hypothetical protein [Caldilinea sp.]MCB0066281.1 hypothetical protein [Caldilineaceae bacterium]MCB0136796.1 hypothetical protein [Caldilineaceae bacterium]